MRLRSPLAASVNSFANRAAGSVLCFPTLRLGLLVETAGIGHKDQQATPIPSLPVISAARAAIWTEDPLAQGFGFPLF
jgi:hypothetical protein